GQAGLVTEWPGQTGQRQRKRSGIGAPGQFDGGSGEQFEGDHSGCRIAGKTEEKLTSPAAEHKWLTRLDERPIEEEFGAEIGEVEFDNIVLSGRHASGEYKDIGVQTLFHQTP